MIGVQLLQPSFGYNIGLFPARPRIIMQRQFSCIKIWFLLVNLKSNVFLLQHMSPIIVEFKFADVLVTWRDNDDTMRKHRKG